MKALFVSLLIVLILLIPIFAIYILKSKKIIKKLKFASKG